LECLLESIQRTVGWCGAVGIRKLTVYDRDGTAISIRPCLARVTNYPTGILSANIEQVSQRLTALTQHHSEDEISEIEYPLTPPPSDVSESRPLSPVNLRSLNLNVSILEVRATTPVKEESIRGVKQRREQPSGHNHTCIDLVTGKTRLNSANTCTDGITIHVISRSSGKPTIAYTANVVANDSKWQQQRIDVQDLNAILEGMSWVIPRRANLPSFL